MGGPAALAAYLPGVHRLGIKGYGKVVQALQNTQIQNILNRLNNRPQTYPNQQSTPQSIQELRAQRGIQ